MKIVMLAAGVGWRLSGTGQTPLALLRFGEQSLLKPSRTFPFGLDDVTLGVGPRSEGPRRSPRN